MTASTAMLLILTALCCLIQEGVAIQWVLFNVPTWTARGDDATLTCQFDLEGERLYSVKWYKREREFYRYVPGEWPSQQAFEQEGIHVELSQSDHQTVTLREVTLDAEGRYKCEVLTEAPHFKTLVKSGVMRVIELPQGVPQVTGGKSEYHLGDLINLTCTAPRSIPQSSLTWFINDQEAPQDYLINYPVTKDRAGRLQAKLGLVFRAERWHFEDDHVTLRCAASIHKAYEKEVHHRGVVVHPLQPALLEDHTSGGGNTLTTGAKFWFLVFCTSLLHL